MTRPGSARASSRDALPGVAWCAAGLFALGFAFWAEHGLGLAPCALCLWERWPYRLLAIVGAVWAVSGPLDRRAAWLRLPVILILLAAVGLAGLHVGVEQHWWPSPLPECAAPRFGGGSIAERLAAMPAHPAKPCDAANLVVSWLPVSMVTLGFVYAVALLTLALVTGPSRRVR